MTPGWRTVSVEKIYPECLRDLRHNMQTTFRQLSFEPIEEVIVNPVDFLGVRICSPELNGVVHQRISSYHTEEPHQTDLYSHFAIKTTNGIIGASKNISELDYVTFQLTFVRGEQSVPPVGQLVAGVLDGKRRVFRAWFPCTFQFYRLVQIILGQETSGLTREDHLADDYLSVNPYRRWLLACYDHGVASTPEEIVNRFSWSKDEYCHVFPALVLILQYEEMPGPNNPPFHRDGGPQITRWSLSPRWLRLLKDKYQLKTYSGEVIVPYMKDVPPVPEGTYLPGDEALILEVGLAELYVSK